MEIDSSRQSQPLMYLALSLGFSGKRESFLTFLLPVHHLLDDPIKPRLEVVTARVFTQDGGSVVSSPQICVRSVSVILPIH